MEPVTGVEEDAVPVASWLPVCLLLVRIMCSLIVV